jgi:hypothetical protein
MKLEFDLGVEAGPSVRKADASPDATRPAPARFDLPRPLLFQLSAASVGYLAVVGLAFHAATGLGLVFGGFGIVLVGWFGLPLLLARFSGAVREPKEQRVGAWGLDSAGGLLTGRAAATQVMAVPLLMLAWALFIVFLG